MTDPRSQAASSPRRLADLSWPEVADRARAGAWLAVPVGATEQHGPHLPLSTDSDLAVALAEGLAARRDDVLVAPVVAYGSSGEHADFPGTLSIGQDATRVLLVELVRSAALTFHRVLLVVGHGGNAAPVAQAVAQLRVEGHRVAAWAPRLAGDAHAGRTETSLMLALHADRVRAAALASGVTTDIAALLPVLQRDGVRAVSPSGVLGDPTGAEAAAGRGLLAQAVASLAAWVDRWEASP